MIFDNFSSQKETSRLEGKCFLKTRTDRFKDHYAVVSGKDLICYRNKDEEDIRVMHCLTSTFIQETQPEINPDNGLQLYPVKIVLPPNKSRVLYFGDQDTAHKWAKAIKAVVGEVCVKDYYELAQNLGKG